MQLREDRARGNTHEFDELCPCRIKSADLLSKTRNKQILACAKVRGMALGKQCIPARRGGHGRDVRALRGAGKPAQILL
jgi:hypothetical protein